MSFDPAAPANPPAAPADHPAAPADHPAAPAAKSRLGRLLVLVPSYAIIVFSTVAIVGSMITALYDNAPPDHATDADTATWCGGRMVTLQADLETRARVVLGLAWDHVGENNPDVADWTRWVTAWNKRLADVRQRCATRATTDPALATVLRELSIMEAQYDDTVHRLDGIRTGARARMRAALIELTGPQH